MFLGSIHNLTFYEKILFSSNAYCLKSITLFLPFYFDLMQYALLIFIFFYRSTEILLMLCNALARGLIISWIPKPKPAEQMEDTAVESSRKAAAKKQEKENIIQSFSVDPSGFPDIKAALEVQTPDFL